MGDPVMKQEELKAIEGYVKTHIAAWLKESKIIPLEAGSQFRDYERELSLTERIVRVEEGIKRQGDLLEKLIHQIDKRFEQVDKRFEQMEKNMENRFIQVEKRFEQVDKRFSQLQWSMGIGFTTIAALMGVFNFF